MPVFNHHRFVHPRLVGVLLITATLAVWASHGAAQDIPDRDKQDKQGKRDDAGTIRLDTDLVSVDVIVTDRDGNRSTALLKATDFTVYEDGARQEISAFSATDVPFNLVLLLDTSGSTRDEVGLIRRAARRFLDELRPQDRIAIIQFNKQVELLED